jgi:hypothetical protein
MKTCCICKVEKESFYFGKRSASKDELRSECKECRKIDHAKNRDIRNKKSLENHYKNRYERLQKMKLYQQSNRNLDGKILKYSIIREHLKENEKLCTKCVEIKDMKNFGKDNSKPDKLNSHCNGCRNDYEKDRINNNPLYKLTSSIRKRISQSLKNSKDKKTEEILGCSLDEFRNYIESKLQEGMTLSNHGLWHLDHIIPISYAKNVEEIYKLNHHTNFQPLWANENLSKGNRYIG